MPANPTLRHTEAGNSFKTCLEMKANTLSMCQIRLIEFLYILAVRFKQADTLLCVNIQTEYILL